jgi:NADH:ubiquinone oxidoreductase subunit 4 (subunit M)
LIVAAVYMLRAVRAALHGPIHERWENLADANDAWRRTPFVLLVAALIALGCFPGLLTERIEPSVARLLAARPTPPGTSRAAVNSDTEGRATVAAVRPEPLPPDRHPTMRVSP